MMGDMLAGQGELLIAIVGAAVVTFIPRVVPMMYLATDRLPPLVKSWLSFVPVAVLAALVGPDILIRNNTLDFSVHNLFLLVALPAMGVAWWTKSFFGTILFSMGAVALARYLGA
ncbi:MAG: AzlD domain-containing protein [Desulfovibrionaceae bacterium]